MANGQSPFGRDAAQVPPLDDDDASDALVAHQSGGQCALGGAFAESKRRLSRSFGTFLVRPSSELSQEQVADALEGARSATVKHDGTSLY
jgi:hypothetical protein